MFSSGTRAFDKELSTLTSSVALTMHRTMLKCLSVSLDGMSWYVCPIHQMVWSSL